MAGVPIGVAKAQDEPITTAIKTARGSAVSEPAMESPIGARRAAVAVLDIKLVSKQLNNKIVSINKDGLGLSPSKPKIKWAMSAPAPVRWRASARASVPANKKTTWLSIA